MTEPEKPPYQITDSDGIVALVAVMVLLVTVAIVIKMFLG